MDKNSRNRNKIFTLKLNQTQNLKYLYPTAKTLT